MELSLFLAQLMGVYLVVQGLFVLLRQDMLPAFLKAFADKSSRGLLLVTGVITLIFGLVLVLSHSIWNGSYQVLITIIGWIVLIKGLSALFFPDGFLKMGNNLIENKTVLTILGLLGILVGLFLANVGFGWGII